MSRAAILCLAAAPAVAIEMPEGCAPYLTLQDRACEVDVYLRCEGPEGVRNRIQNYSPDGLDSVEEATSDWSLLFSIDPPSRSGVVVRDGPATPLSFRVLRETGLTAFDYPIDYYVRGPVPFKTRVTGSFRLTGGETVIDGERMLNVEARMQVEMPEPIVMVETIQTGYYSEALDAFLEGPGTMRVDDRVMKIDRGPVDLIREGEDGFLDVVPRHGCDARDAAWGER